jgi:hypothetical protein
VGFLLYLSVLQQCGVILRAFNVNLIKTYVFIYGMTRPTSDLIALAAAYTLQYQFIYELESDVCSCLTSMKFVFIHSVLSDDRFKAYSKTVPPHGAI